MFLTEMKPKQPIDVKWGVTTFAGENNARAEIVTDNGKVTLEFDERPNNSVELTITGDVDFESLNNIAHTINEYKTKHQGIKVKLQPHDYNSTFVGRYLQGMLD